MNSQKLSFSKKTLFLALFCATSSLAPMGMQLWNNNNNRLTSQSIMGEFSLLNAARCNNENGLNSWLDCGVNVNTKDASSGYTSLHFAASFDNTTMGINLLSRGALRNPQDYDGNTPLHIAVTEKNIPFIELLLRYKADQTIRNNEGKNPMSLLLRKLDQANSNAEAIKKTKQESPKSAYLDEIDKHYKDEIKALLRIHTELLINHLNKKKYVKIINKINL